MLIFAWHHRLMSDQPLSLSAKRAALEIMALLQRAGDEDDIAVRITERIQEAITDESDAHIGLLRHVAHVLTPAAMEGQNSAAAIVGAVVALRDAGISVENAASPNWHLPSASDYVDEPIRHSHLTVIDVMAEQRGVSDAYRNVVLSRINTSCLRLAVFEGEYRWHHHPQSDELFLAVEGRLEIDLAQGSTLVLKPWQAVVIPAATVHRTRAIGRTVNLTFELLGADTAFVD
jgi:mannose-6-phosphate isomerase-like protein (cupin superfamily)